MLCAVCARRSTINFLSEPLSARKARLRQNLSKRRTSAMTSVARALSVHLTTHSNRHLRNVKYIKTEVPRSRLPCTISLEAEGMSQRHQWLP
eukprot:1662573-Pleurochrysis_carterae.AAC.3